MTMMMMRVICLTALRSFDTSGIGPILSQFAMPISPRCVSTILRGYEERRQLFETGSISQDGGLPGPVVSGEVVASARL